MIEEEKVRVRPVQKYACKRNKGPHEWGDLDTEGRIRYVHNGSQRSVLNSDTPKQPLGFKHETFKYSHAEISVRVEVACIHCGKKEWTYLTHKIK